MTCIVGWIEDNKVTMGGDSAASKGYEIQIRTAPKVFIKDNMIFGFTTSFRMRQLIQYSLKIPEQSQKIGDYEYLCSTFIDALIKCLERGKFAEVDNNVIKGGTFLLGYKGSLYCISRDFQVGKSSKNFDACGCGKDYALGALEATKDIKISSSIRIRKALEVASEFSGAVAAPFNILELKGDK